MHDFLTKRPAMMIRREHDSFDLGALSFALLVVLFFCLLAWAILSAEKMEAASVGNGGAYTSQS